MTYIRRPFVHQIIQLPKIADSQLLLESPTIDDRDGRRWGESRQHSHCGRPSRIRQPRHVVLQRTTMSLLIVNFQVQIYLVQLNINIYTSCDFREYVIVEQFIYSYTVSNSEDVSYKECFVQKGSLSTSVIRKFPSLFTRISLEMRQSTVVLWKELFTITILSAFVESCQIELLSVSAAYFRHEEIERGIPDDRRHCDYVSVQQLEVHLVVHLQSLASYQYASFFYNRQFEVLENVDCSERQPTGHECHDHQNQHVHHSSLSNGGLQSEHCQGIIVADILSLYSNDIFHLSSFSTVCVCVFFSFTFKKSRNDEG